MRPCSFHTFPFLCVLFLPVTVAFLYLDFVNVGDPRVDSWIVEQFVKIKYGD
jgi:hypothetical protein